MSSIPKPWLMTKRAQDSYCGRNDWGSECTLYSKKGPEFTLRQESRLACAIIRPSWRCYAEMRPG